MLTNLIDYPIIHVKKNIPSADTGKKNSNPYFSKNFEIEELEDQDTYHANSKPLMYNDINAFVVDWEIPKMEHEV